MIFGVPNKPCSGWFGTNWPNRCFGITRPP